MIQPTIGRVLLYHPNNRGSDELVYPALVAFVHNERCVNLAVFDHHGRGSGGAMRVPVLQDDDQPPETGAYAEWMPYQKGQAGRTDNLSELLKERVAQLEQAIASDRSTHSAQLDLLRKQFSELAHSLQTARVVPRQATAEEIAADQLADSERLRGTEDGAAVEITDLPAPPPAEVPEPIMPSAPVNQAQEPPHEPQPAEGTP